MESKIRIRMSSHDAHYAGNLVDGARMLGLFGDVATELLIQRDGDEGLFRAYETVEFLAPVYGGDYIEAIGKIIQEGKTSRKIEFSAYKVIASCSAEEGAKGVSSMKILNPPQLVCRAVGTCVTPESLQRHRKNP